MNKIDFAAGLRLMRPKQWLKSLFVAMPLFFSGKLVDPVLLFHAASAAAVFGLASSAVYVLNDLRDLAADAAHPKKRSRPIAAGAVTTAQALGLFALLVTAAIIVFVVTGLPRPVATVILIYAAINIAYTLGLKRVSLLELFLVASGYVLRVLAGGFAMSLMPSSWLLAMTGVIAMLIVTAKRRGEIAEGHDPNGNRPALSGYNLIFLDSMISMFAGMTIVFYLLFAMSEYGTGRYGEPALLLTAPVLAYGVLRFVQIAKVSTGVDDPTELIVTDGGLLLSMLVFAAVFAVMLYAV